MGHVLRRPLVLAALAHAAVPRLRPVSVQATTTPAGADYQVAYVVMDDDRTWDVKVGLNAAAGAALEQSDALTRLLAKRLPYAVPRLEGLLVVKGDTTVAVLPHLAGTVTPWRSLAPAAPLTQSIGRALAALHDIDPRIVDEAGLPTYDADAYRARKLAALDRAATTGHVPARLLERWERALEEVTLWKFPTRPTHGPLESHHVLADGQVTAVTGWEHAGVSDPAEDFAPLFLLAPPKAFDTVLEAYAGARRDAPDKYLTRRIRLAAELHRVAALTEAVATGDDELIGRRVAALRRLDEQTVDDDSLLPQSIGRGRTTPVDPEPVDPADIRVVDVTHDEDETVEIPVDGDEEASAESTTEPEPESPGDGAADETGTPDEAAEPEETAEPDETPETDEPDETDEFTETDESDTSRE